MQMCTCGCVCLGVCASGGGCIGSRTCAPAQQAVAAAATPECFVAMPSGIAVNCRQVTAVVVGSDCVGPGSQAACKALLATWGGEGGPCL